MENLLLHLKQVVEQRSWGYHPLGPQSSEPIAIACLACCANDLVPEALLLANELAATQSPKGSVGITRDQDKPAWPTSLAMLAWQAYEQLAGENLFAAERQQAIKWTLKTHGKSLPKHKNIGHDTTLRGWSWAEATHSWLEPTCMFVLSLKAAGLNDHPRTREGVQVIVDRLLELGGCNYGNTKVLGQATLPRVQATGLAMLAVADESIDDPRIDRSLEYLERELSKQMATASLCFALLGLTAHVHRPTNADTLLQHALMRELEYGPSCYKLALLALASISDQAWLPQPKLLATSTHA